MILRFLFLLLTTTVLLGDQTNLVEGRTRLDDWGGKHPNDGWEIGAFEYFPGKWIGVPLLFSPTTNISALPVSLPFPTEVENQIYGKLLSISNYVSQLPDDPTFSHVRDYMTNDFEVKMFFDLNRVMYGFYYNGMYQGTNYHIADYCFLSGIQSNEYVKIIHPPLMLSTNDVVTNYMSGDELKGLQAMWQDNLLKTVMTTNWHKWIKMDYNKPFYYYAAYSYLSQISTNTYTTNELVQLSSATADRLDVRLGTDDDVKMINTIVQYILKGQVGNTNVLNNISIHYETQYWGEIYRNDANQMYNNILSDVVMTLPDSPPIQRPFPPENLRLTLLNQ